MSEKKKEELTWQERQEIRIILNNHLSLINLVADYHSYQEYSRIWMLIGRIEATYIARRFNISLEDAWEICDMETEIFLKIQQDISLSFQENIKSTSLLKKIIEENN